MAKKARTLDTPFRKGERVQTTAVIGDRGEGSEGKVKLANGLGNWRRYWVLFPDGQIVGQISHDELVRPDQVDEWLTRKEEQAQAALRSAEAASETAAAVGAGDGGDGGGDLASRIPAHLLERSRAAKARLLG